MIVPDVNLLVYATNRSAPEHRRAVEWWNGCLTGSETVGLPWAVLLAFLRLTTSVRVVPAPLSFADASTVVDGWLERPQTTVVDPTRRHTAVMRDLLGPVGVAANLVPDGHLAALAIEHGAVLCSSDRDFGRFPGLRWLNPLD